MTFRLANETAACYLTGTRASSRETPRMAQWDDGYVTDVTYTSNFYREITPSSKLVRAIQLGVISR